MRIELGISRVTVRPSGNRQSYEVFQVSGSPGGVRKTWKVVIHVRGEKKALAMARAKRAEWAKLSKPWGSGGRIARMRVDPSSVPESMKFPGLVICPHRAVVMASRSVMIKRDERNFWLCYPYSIEGGSLPTFSEAIEQARKGQAILNRLPREQLWKQKQAIKTANRERKRGESMGNALLSFDAFKAGEISKREMASYSSAYEKVS